MLSWLTWMTPLRRLVDVADERQHQRDQCREDRGGDEAPAAGETGSVGNEADRAYGHDEQQRQHRLGHVILERHAALLVDVDHVVDGLDEQRRDSGVGVLDLHRAERPPRSAARGETRRRSPLRSARHRRTHRGNRRAPSRTPSGAAPAVRRCDATASCERQYALPIAFDSSSTSDLRVSKRCTAIANVNPSSSASSPSSADCSAVMCVFSVSSSGSRCPAPNR